MQYPNNLKNILEEGLEIVNFQPSKSLLEKCGNIALKRFANIMNNNGPELTVIEKQGIENWLEYVTGIEIDILRDDASIIQSRGIPLTYNTKKTA